MLEKQILMSIQPQHFANIKTGKKTRELRTVIPKNFVGWVNLYCTKGKPYLCKFYEKYELVKCYTYEELKNDGAEPLNGKVVARFWFDEYSTYPYVDTSIPSGYEDWDGNWVDQTKEEMGYYINGEELEQMCLSYQEMFDYGKGKDLYAIHIKNLEIFDKPKELGEFKHYVSKTIYSGMDCQPYQDEVLMPIFKAPQNFMYCWGEE